MTHDPSPSAHCTRALPERASLEHLKNEAKQRLKALRRQSPQAKLATAQRALAREYGFASWRQLKAHVDQLDPTRRERKQAGTYIPEAVVMGPRFRGDDSRLHGRSVPASAASAAAAASRARP
jgi:hypothetical protein